MIGSASTTQGRPRVVRRVETLEVRAGGDSLRLATDTAAVRLELLPPFEPSATTARAPSSATEPAAVYPITRLVVLAAYEPCAAAAGEPRVRYLRRDASGVATTDVMLRRESAQSTGMLP
jgi:hypothetical protein